MVLIIQILSQHIQAEPYLARLGQWGVLRKHSEICKTLPFEHRIGCQCVKLFLLKDVNITTFTTVTITTVTITTDTITTVTIITVPINTVTITTVTITTITTVTILPSLLLPSLLLMSLLLLSL